MQTLSLTSIAFYCAFSFFVFYQQLHVKTFRGASSSFGVALNVSAFAGVMTGVAYLLYYGWTVTWWAPIVILVIGLVATTVGIVVEKFVDKDALSVGGFIGWPVSAYFMFSHIPTA